MDTIPTIVAMAMATTQPAIETVPYVGDPAISQCQCVINGAQKPAVSPVQSPLGTVCRFGVPASLNPGTHNIKARYIFTDGSSGGYSDLFYFRRYLGDSGANFWTWQGAVICDPDCVSK